MSNIETTISDSAPAQPVLDLYAEAQRYFMGQANLNNVLTRLVADLKSHGIDNQAKSEGVVLSVPPAVAGG